MKRIRLISITLRNFRGGNGTLTFNGQSACVEGENGTFKSTFVDGHFWLLTDKNQFGDSKFDVKTRDENWNELHGIEHEVTETYMVDGEKVELRKVFHEVYRGIRGSTETTFVGNTNDYYVDGEGVAEKIFKEKVSDIIGDPVVFSLVTNPSYLTDMTIDKDWIKARALLMQYFSKVTEEDVLSGTDEMRELKELVGKKSVDSFKKIVTDKQALLNTQIQQIPTRIDEQTRNMTDVSSINIDAERKTVRDLTAKINDLSLRAAGINTGGLIASLSKELAGINADMQKMETTRTSEVQKAVTPLNQRIAELEPAITTGKDRIVAIEKDISVKLNKIAETNKSIDAAREEYQSKDEEVFHYSDFEYPEFEATTKEICGECGQKIPPEDIEASKAKARTNYDAAREKALNEHNTQKEKALASFNNSKANSLSDIMRRGQNLKEELAALEADLKRIEKEKEDLLVSVSEKENLLYGLTTQRTEAYNMPFPNGYQELADRKATINVEITAEREGQEPNLERIEQERISIEAEKKAAEDKIKLFDDDAKARERVNTLKLEEKELARQYENLERQKFLCEEFTRTQAEMVSEEINQHFKITKWILFEKQINQGIKPVCLATVKAGTYGRGLNEGNKINVGLDVCEAFSKATGIDAPIIVDRAETLTRDIESDMQVIRFIAKRGVKALTLELEPEAVVA